MDAMFNTLLSRTAAIITSVAHNVAFLKCWIPSVMKGKSYPLCEACSLAERAAARTIDGFRTDR